MLCLQRNPDMQKAGTLRSQALHSCSLSWAWAAVSPPPFPTVCDWSTPQTVVATGLSSHQSVCPQPSAVLDILRVPSIHQRSTNTGGGSPSTCLVQLSMCFYVLKHSRENCCIFLELLFWATNSWISVPLELASAGFRPISPPEQKDGL